MEEEKKTRGQNKRGSQKNIASKTSAPKEKAEKVEVVKEKTFSCRGYCNIIGANSGARLAAKLKFGNAGKKTEKEWKEIFQKEQIV